MSGGPAAAVQAAIFAKLNDSQAVIQAFGVAGVRIYDQVPTKPTFPYVVIGEDQVLDDSDCAAAFDVHSTIHVFSRNAAMGLTEAKKIGDALIDALRDGDIAPDGFVSVTSEIESALTNNTYFYDPDRLTAHGVLVFRFLLDQS